MNRKQIIGLIAICVAALLVVGGVFFFVPNLNGKSPGTAGTKTETEIETEIASGEDTGTESEAETDSGSVKESASETASSSGSESETESETESEEESGSETESGTESETSSSETERETSTAPTTKPASTATEPETDAPTEPTTAPPTEPESEPEPTSEAASTPSGETAYITIRAIGDMLMHPPVYYPVMTFGGSYAAGTPNLMMWPVAGAPHGQVVGELDYLFDAFRSEIAGADVAIVNNEAPMAGDELGVRYGTDTSMAFNMLTKVGDAEVRAGFDVILNANNHMRDQGDSGVLRTIAYWKNFPNIKSIGIHESAADQQVIQIIERKGVKIALLNYTYGLNTGSGSNRYLVDLMANADKDKIRSDIARAEQLADFTIVFPHWGDEYSLTENASQQSWALFFTECGADLIIGAHSHCLQPYKTVTAGNGNTAVCYYSLGNYVSNQPKTISNLGGMAEVVLEVKDGKVRIASHGMRYIVNHNCWKLNTSINDYRNDIRPVKLENYSEALAAQHVGHTNNRDPGNPFSYGALLNIKNSIESRSN